MFSNGGLGIRYFIIRLRSVSQSDLIIFVIGFYYVNFLPRFIF